MVGRKKLSKYEDEFFVLFRSAQKAPVEVLFDDAITARRFRTMLYNFRDVLVHTPDYDPELAAVVSKAQLALKDNKLVVSFPQETDNAKDRNT